MLRLALPGWRYRGRPIRRYMDVVRENMEVAGVREKGLRHWVRWR